MTRNVALRAGLTALALCILALPAMVVLGAYVPAMPFARAFGSFLVADLPYMAFLTTGSLGLVGIALAIGGGRWTKLLGAASLVVLGAIVVAGLALARTLSDHGAAYDPMRQLGPEASARPANERVVFATVDGTDLHADVWLPPNEVSGPTPVVVYVHGGGFVGGELGMRPLQLAYLADRGYTVFEIEYRLAPPPRWHDAPADVLCALAWLGARAQDRQIDPNRVIVMGESAGGNLALVASYAAGTGAIEPSCAGAPVVPKGVIGIAPAVDIEALWSDPTLWYEERPLPEAYVGGPPSEYPDRYAAAAPFAYVRRDVPSTLILAGANDRTIALDHVRRLQAALTAAGADVEVVVLPFADHGFDGFGNGPGAQLLEALLPSFIEDVTE